MDYPLDAHKKPFGRVASEIAVILQGKKRAAYDPRVVGKDRVLLSNYKTIAITGRKQTEKVYHRHTGYMGHLRTLTFEQAFAKNPKAVIWEAVRRMLPKNFLNQKRRANLIFVEDAS